MLRYGVALLGVALVGIGACRHSPTPTLPLTASTTSVARASTTTPSVAPTAPRAAPTATRATGTPSEYEDTAPVAPLTTLPPDRLWPTTSAPLRVESDESEQVAAPTSEAAHTPTNPGQSDTALTRRQYRMYERSPEVVALQMLLGLGSIDGIYGPVTRAAHVDFLGGPAAALYVFHPEFGDLESVGGDPLPTLGVLVDRYFRPGDRAWALRVAFCESSADPSDVGSNKVSSALAVGWFQHLAKFWTDRSEAAGWGGYDPFHGEANVAVAAWLLYEGGGPRHWNPSRTCWEAE